MLTRHTLEHQSMFFNTREYKTHEVNKNKIGARARQKPVKAYNEHTCANNTQDKIHAIQDDHCILNISVSLKKKRTK